MSRQPVARFNRSGVQMIEQMETIRQRAYEIWQAEGQPDGRALEHWCRAEAEAVQSRPVAKAAAAKPKAPARKARSKARN